MLDDSLGPSPLQRCQTNAAEPEHDEHFAAELGLLDLDSPQPPLVIIDDCKRASSPVYELVEPGSATASCYRSWLDSSSGNVDWTNPDAWSFHPAAHREALAREQDLRGQRPEPDSLPRPEGVDEDAGSRTGGVFRELEPDQALRQPVQVGSTREKSRSAHHGSSARARRNARRPFRYCTPPLKEEGDRLRTRHSWQSPAPVYDAEESLDSVEA